MPASVMKRCAGNTAGDLQRIRIISSEERLRTGMWNLWKNLRRMGYCHLLIFDVPVYAKETGPSPEEAGKSDTGSSAGYVRR